MFLSCLKKRKGQAVVEFTFIFLLFLFIFFSIVEFGHLLYTKLTLQHALREAGRYMVTGRTAQDPQNNNLPRPEVILKVFCANLLATGLSCPQLGPQFDLKCVDPPSCTQPGGGPGQTVMVTANFKKRALTPLFAGIFTKDGVEFQLSTTWKNEPFPTE